MKYIIFAIFIVSSFYVYWDISYNKWYMQWGKFACEETFYVDWIDFIPKVWCWDKEANSDVKNIYDWKRK